MDSMVVRSWTRRYILEYGFLYSIYDKLKKQTQGIAIDFLPKRILLHDCFEITQCRAQGGLGAVPTPCSPHPKVAVSYTLSKKEEREKENTKHVFLH